LKMDTVLSRPRADGILFAEDFDVDGFGAAVAEATTPASAAPGYGAEDIEAARVHGWEAGRIAARHELEAADEARVRQAIARLAVELDAASAAAVAVADKTATAIARLLMSTLGAVLPTLCAAHGEAEAIAVARAILPGLAGEPVITIRANPHTAPALGREIARLDPDLPARVRLLPTDALLPGDVRIAWQDGTAARDTTELWNEIVAVLTGDGLIHPNQAAGVSRHGG
jgi:flagellar biosynthesis/type III secretory pathway protein FliH